ncbi:MULTISPECIES: NAD(P)/FAD-dependent oxidoreductase [unclassified Fusibacter]|uniref:NAD(P)/FAD-dependent oxidoreductase n=1 Tax=unclassified Fusibacter TaxID=2624464 RepID=UPI00101338F0|nr:MULTISPECIES: NAD(P)/FAD-dependent oxidoreductase [unclassified Fusibacter]MCK8059140.1 NAD(P)/FAD-dependent oxidoreductase [Fusibacter sp. A2]NPE22549.1 NAD(P)/FAD-dependent oxidoreductase [Fusibacter sp. A1]RXV60651.1 FAD/NAD(P)-binding oxidoreductase [Fusibacter sp. A1]
MNSIKRLERELQKRYNKSIKCSRIGDSIRVEGNVMTHEEVVAIGYRAAKTSFKQVVNDVTPFFDLNLQKIQSSSPVDGDDVIPSLNQPRTCDVLIIGAGIIGASIARELSKYELDIVLVDKEYDVAVHTSSRNDGMIHPGIASPMGTLKLQMNLRGNHLYEQVSKELGVPIRRCGSSILFRSRVSKLLIPYFVLKAKIIKMPGLSIMSKRKVYEKEPHLAPGISWGVFCASAGVTSPYKMTVAYAENAVINGVELRLNTEVKAMSVETDTGKILEVKTENGVIRPMLTVNAAGAYADIIAEMADDRYYSIHPRKGEIVLLDKKKADRLTGILGFVGDRSDKNTKGGGLVKTYENNILIGPNAFEVSSREDYSTDSDTIGRMLATKIPQVTGLVKEDVITYFSGIRAATYKEDFIIEASNKVGNLIHVAGIQSPGFASAPAIAERVEMLVGDYFSKQADANANFRKKEIWNPIRQAIPEVCSMPYEERTALIRSNPDYGEIVCRCEEISRGEIIDALSGPIEIDSVDAVKRRVRAGMGRCQGGFCLPLVMEIIQSEKGIPLNQITKKGKNSTIAAHSTKEV